MQAMILAAGFGTRLLPLTARRPKCLMPVMNRPLLGLWLERLAAQGVTRAVVNTHHLAPVVHDFLTRGGTDWPAVAVSHEPEILGTGGGPAAARSLLADESFFLVNADILADRPLPELERARAEAGALAALALVDEPRFNTVALDAEGRVLGFRGDPGLPAGARWRTYSGLAALSTELLGFLPGRGYSTLVDGLRAAMAAGRQVLGLETPGFWDDLGTPERLWRLHRDLAADPPPGLACLAPDGPLVLAADAVVEPGATLAGFCVLGPGARVAAGARLADSVLLAGAELRAGARVSGAILGDGYLARGVIQGGAHA